MKYSIAYIVLALTLLLTGCARREAPEAVPETVSETVRETLVEIVEMPAIPKRSCLFTELFAALAEGRLAATREALTPAAEALGCAVQVEEGVLTVEDPSAPSLFLSADLYESGAETGLTNIRLLSDKYVKTARIATLEGLPGQVSFFVQTGIWGEPTQAASLEDLWRFLETGDIARRQVILGEYQTTIRLQRDEYPLLVRYYEDGENAYSYELTLGEQSLFQPGRLNYLPGSLHDCLEVADLNGDGYEDLLVTLGTREGNAPKDCYVYLPGQGYTPVEDFATLSNPRWSAELGRIVDTYDYGAQRMTERFTLNGTALERRESLLRCETENGAVYYEYADVNGVSTLVKDGVGKDAIDWEDWNR